MPIGEAHWLALSTWSPGIILLTLLLGIALAFIVLSMAKERQELQQRVDALTDALTGLPNRRALFEVADALGQNRQIKADAISVLIFDLDHFKETNDRFGHALGDRVLRLFATTRRRISTERASLRGSAARSSRPSCRAPIRLKQPDSEPEAGCGQCL